MPEALTREQLAETVEHVKQFPTMQQAADALNITYRALHYRLKSAARAGLMLGEKPAMPGFRVSQVTTHPDGKQTIQQKPEHGGAFEMPAGHVIKGKSTLIGPDGATVLEWIKTKEGQIDPLAIAEQLKTSFADYKPAALPAPTPAAPAADLLTLLPCNDWHVGMFAWKKDSGENWDLKISLATIGAAVEDTVARSPSSAECIVLGGGDLLHADNSENKTAKSGNVLQVDGRYPKVVDAAAMLMVKTVDAALGRHQHVTVRILPGNHDEHSAVAIAYFLRAWYRNEPRVTVDVDPSLFFWFRFGQVMLGATHGHTVKLAQMPSIMAHRRAEDWGATKFRYVHGFHIHHSSKVATEGNGVICESHQAPIPQDAWHFGAGFLSGRSLQAITYHRDFGEIGRVRTAILDAAA